MRKHDYTFKMITISFSTLLLILCMVLSSCSGQSIEPESELVDFKENNVNYVHRDWLYNPGMPKFFPYIAALQDFVFVGEVVSDPVPVKLGEDDNYEVFTLYSVRVLFNIRGTLVYDTDIPVLKDGGYDEEKSYYVLSEHDNLPRKGEICIIAASIMDDGSYRLSTCGFTSFTAIGIEENYYKKGDCLSNGIRIGNASKESFKGDSQLSLTSIANITDISDIEEGLVIPNKIINNPGGVEIQELLMHSTLVRLWSEAVSDEYAVECKRERIMDSPYGMPGSPSYSETTLPYPDEE